MSDLRTRLERIGDRAHPAPDAFARFEGKRRRRERNRRVSAGVVAFVVAAAGSIGIFSLVSDDGENVLGGGEGEFLALWPESTLEAALAEQDAVDAGDPARRWRLDPEATALRFVSEALGWPETPQELAHSSTTSPDGRVTVDVVTGVVPGPCQRPECAGRDVTVTLRQLLPSAGIWSVVAAQSAVFNIALHVNEEVEIGADVQIAAGFDNGTEVALGFAGTGLCDAFHEETAQVTDLSVGTVVPDALAGCSGYVYALTPATPVGQVELGRIMFVYHEPRPALDYTIQAITAVPVTFVDPAGTSSEPAEVGRIVCDGVDPIVQTPVVATRPDGVHVEVSNPTEQAISFSIGPDVGSPDQLVASLAPGTVELVLTGAPGAMSFSCSPPPEEGQAGVSGLGSFEVVDPAGNYVPAELECDTGSAYGSGAAQPAGGVGFAGDPVQVARDHVSGLEFDDLVQRAGYIESEQPMIRIVRAEAVVGKVTLTTDGSGGWLLSSIEGCGGTQFGWSEEASGVSGPMGPTGSGSQPGGAFGWCPEAPFLNRPADWIDRASEVAIQFVLADMNGDEAASQALLDDSVPPGTAFSFELAEDAVVVTDTEGRGGGMVRFDCGSAVDAHTVAVTIDDGTDSASLDFTLFLVLREDGWKVWGKY